LPRFVPPPVTSTTRPARASAAKICEGDGMRDQRRSSLIGPIQRATPRHK
jgi:hypothetical protein